MAAAAAFSNEAQPLAEILHGMAHDTERAALEPLEIFPVCHHSPASAVHLVRRLRDRPPRLILMEGCEDMIGLLEGLRNCRLPVALQAFAPKPVGFPEAWSPLNLVMPLSEFSAEFQAIAFALENPKKTRLLFVDRSVDHVYQWLPQEDRAVEDATPKEAPSDGDPDEKDEANMHGAAIGVEMGSLTPTFGQFTELLLKNAQVQHYTEWWDRYVETPIIGASYATYRQAMFLVGSLIRRLGQKESDRREDSLRERYMWTRMKEALAEAKVAPKDAIYICGAAHSASQVEEFGIENDRRWEIPPRTETEWLYGLLPSSYAAIERQFGHPRGALSLSESAWKKNIKRQRLKAFSLKPGKNKPQSDDGIEAEEEQEELPAPKTSAPPVEAEAIVAFLQDAPPDLAPEDDDLIHWSVRITGLARKHGYLASTADSIAIYQTAVLLANMRNRRGPTPWDFRDAAVTCLEKDRVPKKRDIQRICDIMLGGDRVGEIGYDSLPPLAQNVYDRLKALPIQVQAKTIQRALMDFKKNPELLECSQLLWKLRYLLPTGVVRPIIGQLSLGYEPAQESWDVAIGKYQGALIQLGYEGITIEGVLERRLKAAAFKPEAKTVQALAAAEDCLLLMKSARLTEELGDRARLLLVEEEGLADAQEIYERIRRLVQYYRGTPGGVAPWCCQFIKAGYSHYTTLLPNAFGDRGVTPSQIASMLAFVFTLEGLALSVGCHRSQLLIAVQQAGPMAEDPAKKSLLWAAEVVLQLRTQQSLRAMLSELLANPLAWEVLPDYLSGFLLSLSFTPLLNRITVELLGRAFSSLPDHALMSWLPGLLMTLRPHAGAALPALISEASRLYPKSSAELGNWRAPWDKAEEPVATPRANLGTTAQVKPEVHAARALLRGNPGAVEFWAVAAGGSAEWTEGTASVAVVAESGDGGGQAVLPEVAKARVLLGKFAETAEYFGRLAGQ